MTGSGDKLDAFIKALNSKLIREVVRTGVSGIGRGDKPEWRHNQDYWREREEIPAIDLDAPEFLYDGERRPQPREIPISATG